MAYEEHSSFARFFLKNVSQIEAHQFKTASEHPTENIKTQRKTQHIPNREANKRHSNGAQALINKYCESKLYFHLQLFMRLGFIQFILRGLPERRTQFQYWGIGV